MTHLVERGETRFGIGHPLLWLSLAECVLENEHLRMVWKRHTVCIMIPRQGLALPI